MAGNYFNDPRPFYGLDRNDLISMDEFFYGKRDPWYMHQAPPGYGYGPYEGAHQRSRSMDLRRPEQFVQSHDQYREYRRPDFRDDTHNFHHQDMQHPGKGNQKGNHNHNQHGGGGGGGGNNNNHNNNHNNNNNNNSNNNQKKKQQKQQQHDSDEESDDFSSNHKQGNKGGHGHHQSHGTKGQGWSDNRGFQKQHHHHHHHHRRSLSLTQTVLKKLGLRDDTSSDSSDDERYRKPNKAHSGGKFNHTGGGRSDPKPYTVRFDDQSFGHQKHKGVHGLGEDHEPHGKKGGHQHGGQPQGILKKPKGNHNDGYSSEEEVKHQKKGGNQHHGGGEMGKKGGQSGGKQLGRSQSMDFRVNLCCENCERKVRKSLEYMDDVDQVLCDQWNNRVVVVGNAKPESVLKKLRKVKKDTHFWQPHK